MEFSNLIFKLKIKFIKLFIVIRFWIRNQTRWKQRNKYLDWFIECLRLSVNSIWLGKKFGIIKIWSQSYRNWLVRVIRLNLCNDKERVKIDLQIEILIINIFIVIIRIVIWDIHLKVLWIYTKNRNMIKIKTIKKIIDIIL